jgi:hypothetical protein
MTSVATPIIDTNHHCIQIGSAPNTVLRALGRMEENHCKTDKQVLLILDSERRVVSDSYFVYMPKLRG